MGLDDRAFDDRAFDDRRARGAAGEALAAAWYEAAGYDVLDRNWRCRDGELDLVCRLGGTVVFCEVKARRTAAYGTPADAVTAAKRRRVRRLAAKWLADRHVRCAVVRFDVAAVTGDEIEVIVDAF
ncbi:MAG TPA: YraN family protein [Acidimicrobiales bacterium]